ncbi:hypothetical protein Celaphus_00004628 [Cervus elaphus hippelaphus]|uniref:Uncharacterized protein n=1 Tax=Cervus elaphus hippelaphus TaxID=46360 RepID=A0A212DCC7_CEREH|nr:hypothetical protein Celaphus_00004628 [Cervus elaphus hippelaphus]
MQPRAAATARAAANRSKERASDRSGLGTCKERARVSTQRHEPLIGSRDLPRLRLGGPQPPAAAPPPSQRGGVAKQRRLGLPDVRLQVAVPSLGLTELTAERCGP